MPCSRRRTRTSAGACLAREIVRGGHVGARAAERAARRAGREECGARALPARGPGAGGPRRSGRSLREPTGFEARGSPAAGSRSPFDDDETELAELVEALERVA